MFRTHHILSLFAAVALAGCEPTAPQEPAVTAATPLISKKLVAGENHLMLNANGTVTGLVRGKAVAGVYSADAKEICSTYTAPDFLADKEFCSTPVIASGEVVFHRRDGSKSPAYTITQ